MPPQTARAQGLGPGLARPVRFACWGRWRAVTALLLTLVSPVGQAAPPPEAAPVSAQPAPLLPQSLSADQLTMLEALPDEKPYNVRIHFMRSNERRHDLFFKALRGIGGAYIGVGADQNYTLAAVAQAELLLLTDIDGDVVQWHKIYAALIPQAPTPLALCQLLAGERDAVAKAALVERWGPLGLKLWPTFLRYRGMLLSHLQVERKVMRRGSGATWMSNLTLYQHIRGLMQQHRVIAHVGDLHGETTLVNLSSALRQAKVVVRTLYISNVEQWFRYSPQFRRNMQALPRDAKTLVLRTLARGELPIPDEDRWHFSVQTLDDFIARMESTQAPATEVQDFMPEMVRSARSGSHGLSFLGAVTEQPRPLLPWKVLPPLRLLTPESMPLLPAAPEPAGGPSLVTLPPPPMVSGPVVSPRPAVIPTLPPPPTVSLPPEPVMSVPPPRPVQRESASAVVISDWTKIPPLRTAEVQPGPRLVPWPMLPQLRGPHEQPQQRVPWRLLPRLRLGGLPSQR